MASGNVAAAAIPMRVFVQQISSQLERPVVDKTGLTGLYDIDFHWTPERNPQAQHGELPPGINLPPVDPNGPTIFTALQDQLGLKLESATGPVEVIVIERVEKPSEN